MSEKHAVNIEGCPGEDCALNTPGGAEFIPLSVPHLSGNEWTYAKECLDTNWVSSSGSFVDRFERELAHVAGTKFAVATVNGTAALHTALMLAGVCPGDEVIVSDLTFIAPANTIRYVGAHPVFVDAEPVYWQMDIQKLKDFLSKDCYSGAKGVLNRATGRRVRAIMPVHILGSVCDMKSIMELAERYNLPVIEDATECLGARFGERPAGSLGQMGCFSFNGNKILTTGGGGMIVTNDEGLARRARYLTVQAKDNPQEFIHGEVGYNYRLPNILAAIGCAQLENLSTFVLRKRETATAYTNAFSDIPGIDSMREPPDTFSTFWLYTIRIDKTQAGIGSRDLMKMLDARRIQTRPLWQPMHLSPAQQGAFATDCTVSEVLNRQCLSLPCSVGLTSDQRSRVISTICGDILTNPSMKPDR